MIRQIAAQDLDAVADLEAGAFARPLTRDDLTALYNRPAFCGFVLVTDDGEVASYALFLNAGDAADLVSTGTAMTVRRRGCAARLLRYALHRIAAAGVADITLEVAVDNAAALALYAGLGFHTVGRRDGYYRRSGGRVDALVMQYRPVAQGTA